MMRAEHKAYTHREYGREKERELRFYLGCVVAVIKKELAFVRTHNLFGSITVS